MTPKQTPKQWMTEEAIVKRIFFLSDNFGYRIINSSIQLFAKSVRRRAKWRFLTKNDASVCPDCKYDRRGRRRHGREYWTGQFMPKLDRHFGDRCTLILVKFV